MLHHQVVRGWRAVGRPEGFRGERLTAIRLHSGIAGFSFRLEF